MRRFWLLPVVFVCALFLTGCGSQRPQELRDAAALGDEETVQAILRHSPELAGDADPLQVTPLHLAASRGAEAIVADLIAAGASPNVSDLLGFTPLHWAARCGSLPVVRRLIGAKAVCTAAARDRWTPLHYALIAANDRLPNPERVDILRLLIANKADVNAPAGRWNVTPLHLAAHYGTPAMVEALLAAGADRGARDSDGRTALDEARQRQAEDIVRLLQEPAAKP